MRSRYLRVPGRFVVATILSATLLGSASPYQIPIASGAADERTALFKWFDSVGYPEMSTGEFVEISYQRPYDYGFLKPGAASREVVTTIHLERMNFGGPISPSVSSGPSKYKRVDFTAWMKDFMRDLPTIKFDRDSWLHVLPITSVDALVVLSRACAARGLYDYSKELFDCVNASVHPFPNESLPKINPATYVFKKDVGTVLLWELLYDFMKPSVSRADLLSRLKSLARDNPAFEEPKRSEEGSYIAKAIVTLDQMIREDAEHAAKPAKPLDELSIHDRIAELIFQLRDDTAGGYFAKAGSPAAQLEEIGLPAVPQLLDELTDMRFTRGPGNGRRSGLSNGPNGRIRDVAISILSSIAGYNLLTDQWDSMSAGTKQHWIDDHDEGAWTHAISAARSWWALVQQKGKPGATWPAKYAFDASKPTGGRDRQMAELLRTWKGG